MEEFKNIRNIVFDYDGTLNNSLKIYAPSFKIAYNYLVETNQAIEKKWTDEEISMWLGYSSRDMWNSFMPNLLEEEKQKCSNLIGSSMVKLIDEGRAELYKGTIETLKYLKDKGYNIIFLSNCKIEYMNKHKEMFSLDKYFNDFYCTEQFDFKPKYEIFEVIKNKHIGSFIIIGDRDVDIEIANIHNEKSIGCSYGYGRDCELANADVLINDITDLIKIL